MAADSLAAALAAVQGDLPAVRKGETAKVQTKDGGSYSYSYADLADVSAVVLPLLAKHGLSFLAKPTTVDGRFVLSYSLLHSSGEREDGEYPLPTNGTPQQVGSAITYARRYVLCAVTGVAPEDDDGQAAEQAARQPSRPASPPPASANESPADAIVRLAGPDMNALAWFLLDRFDTAKVAALTDEQKTQVVQLLEDDRAAVLAEGQRKAEEAAA